MKLEGELTLLRVHLRSTDKHGWHNAAEDLVERARHQGLAGSTVLRGTLGLDADGRLLEPGFWSLGESLPMIVEMVDEPDKILAFLPEVREIVPEGFATLERAHVLTYRHGQPGGRQALRPDIPSRVAELSTVPTVEEPAMSGTIHDGQLLRIFIGDNDQWQGAPLAPAIVYKARELGLAGATVLHGAMGYGANSRVHADRLLELSRDLPIVIEIVDSAERIQSLLPFLDECVGEGMITIESVRVIRYRAGSTRKSA